MAGYYLIVQHGNKELVNQAKIIKIAREKVIYIHQVFYI